MKKNLIALALVAVAGGAQADVITQSDAFGYQTTNWTHALGGLSQFDSSLGTLNSVIISLTGSINQSLVAENIGGSADALTPVAGGTLRFRQGGSVVLNQVLPTTSGTTFFATAFDGTDDKAGTSGVNFGILSASASNTVTLTDPADLAGFIGAGFLSNYDLRAIGNGMILTGCRSSTRFSRIPATTAETKALTGRATVSNGSSRAQETVIESTPDSGVAMRKAVVAPLLAPCRLSWAAAGNTPQEQSGIGTPSNAALRTERIFP